MFRHGLASRCLCCCLPGNSPAESCARELAGEFSPGLENLCASVFIRMFASVDSNKLLIIFARRGNYALHVTMRAETSVLFLRFSFRFTS